MNQRAGFTLLEILVALSVFAILATLTSSVMYHAFNTRALVTQQADRLSAVQLAMARIQRDTQQITTRTVRGNQLHVIPAFIGRTDYSEFTRSGEANPNDNTPLSTFRRIAYVCHDNQLIRRSWDAADTPNRQRFQDTVLLDKLNQCKLAYLAHDQRVLSTWHTNAIRPNQRREPLPNAIQLTLNLTDWGNMSLLFIIPEALYAE